MQRMHCHLSIYHSSSCFSKWPNWPKSSYSGRTNESHQYQAFISGRQSSDTAALFCCGSGGVEVAGVNRTLDPNRPASGNWLKKSPVFFSKTHEWMESGLLCGRAVHRLIIEWKCVRRDWDSLLADQSQEQTRLQALFTLPWRVYSILAMPSPSPAIKILHNNSLILIFGYEWCFCGVISYNQHRQFLCSLWTQLSSHVHYHF